MMKVKPNLSAAERFMQAGSATAADGAAPAASVPRVTKTFRIDPALDLALKRAVLEHRTATGQRATESDLLEAAIKQYLQL